MAPDLPPPIAAYFAADRQDGEALAECFTEHGVVKDESRAHRGRAAIAQWKAAASARYNYRSEPFAMANQDGRIVVTSHVVGDFPGSPIDLRYFFVLEGDKIAVLEIVP
jgi:SnoaL-like domain